VLLNEEAYKEFVQKFPAYAYKAEVIASGADHLERIEEKPVFIQDKKPMALYVGVVKPVKQIDKLISAVGDMYCVIAGPQEEQYKKSLQIGKTQNIQFIKNMNDGQLKWLYSRADVMVYTSEHEGFCFPVLEALISGLPVVALDLPIFRIYQKYFPHLTLVKSEDEMRGVIKSIKFVKSKEQKEHPYKWKVFNEKLQALWQPTHLPRPANKKIAFIVVLYKTPIQEKKRLEQEIHGIYSSNRSNVQTLKRTNEYKIYWIDNSANGKGYAAGVNEGVRQGLIDGCEEFVALNPDISLKGITAENIAEVCSEFDVWGLAMKQNGEVYYGGEVDKWRLSGGLVKEKPKMRLSEVDFVSGSLMGFSRAVVHTIGLLDESYFMYYEDVDYCVRAKRKGLQVGIDTSVVYSHFEESQKNMKKDGWIAKARWKFFWKYANAKQKIREIVRLPKTILYKN
jgi:GT2 family glycosyltransferase